MANAIISGIIITHILLPLALLFWVGFSRASSRLSWLMILILTAAWLLTFHIVGAGWGWVGWIWPWVFWALLPLAAGRFYNRRWPYTPWIPPKKVGSIIGAVVLTLIALPLAVDTFRLPGAGNFEGEPLDLRWPLRGGTFLVLHGGGNELVNHHFTVPAQRYALDVLAVNAFGLRASGFLPDDLDSYMVWGTPILAPCTGEVLAAVDGLPDRPIMDPDPENLLGNYVTIFCKDATLLFAHIREGSVAVTAGDSVSAGQQIGEVGNSGNTTEPHLHIHAVRGRVTEQEELAYTGEALPMTFEGRFLRRNKRILVR